MCGNFSIQTQLRRLTEYFLRKANLPVICRTAETEFAVADAINIEKEVADRSNSKVVYLNLCSQEMLHHSDNSKSSRASEAYTLPSAEVPIEESDQATDQVSTDPVILDALRNAGLMSDSPPNSPQSEKEVFNKDEPSVREEGPDDVFDMDSYTELDIYGDFEYDLDDEDYIGASKTEVSKQPPEEGASKMKVVFSTLNSEKLNGGTDIDNHGKPGNFEAPKDSTLPQNHSDAGISTTMEGETANSCVAPEPFSSENGEEPSIVECEELYGPDKEPLIKKFPEVASRKLYGQVDAVAENKDPVENENNMSNKVVNAENMFVATVGPKSSGGQHSPSQFQTGENVEIKEKKSSTETSKRSDSFNRVFKKVGR